MKIITQCFKNTFYLKYILFLHGILFPCVYIINFSLIRCLKKKPKITSKIDISIEIIGQPKKDANFLFLFLESHMRLHYGEFLKQTRPSQKNGKKWFNYI